jgi:hypothetical protein
LLVLLVLLFAFGLRLYDLNARALWFDEGMEYWVAAVGLPDLAESVRVGIQDPPLYSLLLHVWMGGGQNEFYLRFLSVILSFLSVAGVVRIGYHASGWPTGWMAGVLMALLPPQIRYAQEIGQYALMQCLLVGAVVVLQRLRARSSLSKYLRWLLVALAATYSYYGTVITVLVPFGLVWISALLGKKWTTVKKGIFSLVAYFVGILPLILYFLPHQLLRGPTREAFTLHLGTPLVELQSLWLSTQQLIAFQFTGWPWTAVPSSVPLVLVALSLLFAIRERSRLLLWLFVTWGIYYAFGKLALFPYGYRYSLILTPLLVPTIAQGLSSLLVRKRWRAVGGLVLLGLLLLCTASLPNHTLRARLYPEQNWAWPETQELRPLVEHWINNRDDETPTYVYYGAVPAFSYYQQLYDQRTFDHLSPAWYAKCWRGEITGYCQSGEVLYGRGVRKLAPPEKVTAVRDALGPSPDSLWLVFSHVYADEDTVILAGFLEEYQILSELRARGASIYLLGK